MVGSELGRFRLISVAISLFAVLLIGRLYFLQVVAASLYTDRASRQYEHSVSRLFNRNSIFFQNKDGTLTSAATLLDGYTIAINPSTMTDPDRVLSKLSHLIPLEREDFMRRAANKDDKYEEVGKRLPQEIADKISALGEPSVSAYKDRWRYYPQGSVASHILGFVGYDDDILRGQYGLERYYNDTLLDTETVSFSDFFSGFVGRLSGFGREEGGDIVTTIEPAVEKFLEDEIGKLQKKWNPKTVGGIVMDPHTGEILAMAASPDFDPNNFHKEKDIGVFSNPLLEHVYELGSIMKALTMVAGIDSGTVTPLSEYVDKGSLTLNEATVYNFDKKARGRVSMQQVLSQSLNTGAAHVALSMGKQKFAEYIKKFGLGDETGIDLPNEAAGIIKNVDSGFDIDTATAAYGQGLAVSPIEMVRALTALANKGIMTTPHLVKSVEYKGLPRKVLNWGKGDRVIREESAEEISRMLVTVVDEALLEGAVKMKDYSIAAKTGTALLSRTGERGYYDDRFVHSFFGYFPAFEPRFLVFFFAVDPRGVTYASHSLTVSFIETAKFLINYYAIAPDRHPL